MMLPNIRNILFAAGLGDDTGYVFEHALNLAQKYAASIHIVHSHEALNINDQNLAEIFMLQEGMSDNFDSMPLDTEEKVAEYLEGICQKVISKFSAEAGVIANIRVSRHAPKSAILTAAEDFAADLIVMGSHRHTAVTDSLLGSTTMKVLHSASIPVLVVRLPKKLSTA